MLLNVYEVEKNRQETCSQKIQKYKDNKEKWRQVTYSPKIQGHDEVLNVLSSYAMMQTFIMTFSRIFDKVKRPFYYVPIPQLLKDTKIGDVPYDDIIGAISRTQITT